MPGDSVTFARSLGARIRERQTGIVGTVTHQCRDTRGVGYWIVFLDADGHPCERYVADIDADAEATGHDGPGAVSAQP